MNSENTNLVLISGKSSTGKSASLMFFDNPQSVVYLNCENNKRLPFKSKFNEFTITDPLQVYQAFDEVEQMKDVDTVVIDTLTYLMDMYETKYVLSSSNTMKA
jgi:archaellum biogenesis ATPase FlaH